MTKKGKNKTREKPPKPGQGRAGFRKASDGPRKTGGEMWKYPLPIDGRQTVFGSQKGNALRGELLKKKI